MKFPIFDERFPDGTLPSFGRKLKSLEGEWGEVGRSAAVCMLFVPGTDPSHPAQLILNRRSTRVKTHVRQIGFPGGLREEIDSTPEDTALRELREELGVDPSAVKIHGALDSVRSLERSEVVVLVGSVDLGLNRMKPNEEVDEIIVAPWNSFLREHSTPFRFNLFGNWRESHLFQVSPDVQVWGMTAQMIFNADLKA